MAKLSDAALFARWKIGDQFRNDSKSSARGKPAWQSDRFTRRKRIGGPEAAQRFAAADAGAGQRRALGKEEVVAPHAPAPSSRAGTCCSRTCRASARPARPRDRAGHRRRVRRIQFTSDMLPADVVGGMVETESEGTRFRRAADRERRAGRRDQPHDAEDAVRAARGDGERQVTVDGETHSCRAVHGPRDAEPARHDGTYPLPEASSTGS